MTPKNELHLWGVLVAFWHDKSKEAERALKGIKNHLKESPGRTPPKKKRKRATQAEMAERNRKVSLVVDSYETDHGRPPMVHEVADKAKIEDELVYTTNAYNEGRITKVSAKSTTAMYGSSVKTSEFYGERAEQHGRANRKSETDQNVRDALIDQSRKDNDSDPSPLE